MLAVALNRVASLVTSLLFPSSHFLLHLFTFPRFIILFSYSFLLFSFSLNLCLVFLVNYVPLGFFFYFLPSFFFSPCIYQASELLFSGSPSPFLIFPSPSFVPFPFSILSALFLYFLNFLFPFI